MQHNLVTVLDIDSHYRAAFDDTDRVALERIVDLLRPCFTSQERI
jgi:putative methionine-R-sulfoxide reductase with GAF domain